MEKLSFSKILHLYGDLNMHSQLLQLKPSLMTEFRFESLSEGVLNFSVFYKGAFSDQVYFKLIVEFDADKKVFKMIRLEDYTASKAENIINKYNPENLKELKKEEKEPSFSAFTESMSKIMKELFKEYVIVDSQGNESYVVCPDDRPVEQISPNLEKFLRIIKWHMKSSAKKFSAKWQSYYWEVSLPIEIYQLISCKDFKISEIKEKTIEFEAERYRVSSFAFTHQALMIFLFKR